MNLPDPLDSHLAVAMALRNAARKRRGIDHVSAAYRGLTLQDAYLIQGELEALEVADGAKVVGRKIGATSEAIQRRFGLNEPDSGFLTDRMILSDGACIQTNQLIAPLVEGEIAFILDKPLFGSAVSVADVLEATSKVVPVLEVLDTRYNSWKISLIDTVADNASCAMVVMGTPVTFDHVKLDRAQMTMVVGGTVYTALGSAVLGHPAEAVAQLVRILGKGGRGLSAGEIVLAGSWGEAVPVRTGDSVSASFSHLGSVAALFV